MGDKTQEEDEYNKIFSSLDTEKLTEISKNRKIPIIHIGKNDRITINKILKYFQNSSLGGHEGIHRTTNKIKKNYAWKGMHNDIQNFIKLCTNCQQNKHFKKTKMPMEITSTGRFPFERIAVDIVGPLPETNSKNKYILSIQDDLTKFMNSLLNLS